MTRNPTLRPAAHLPQRLDLVNSAARIFYGCIAGSAVLLLVAITIF